MKPLALLLVLALLAGCASPGERRARLLAAWTEAPMLGADVDRCTHEADVAVHGRRMTAGVLMGVGVLVIPLLFVGIGFAVGAADKAQRLYSRCMLAAGHAPRLAGATDAGDVEVSR